MPTRIAIRNCEKCYETTSKIDKADIIQVGVRDNYTNEAMKALNDEIKAVDLEYWFREIAEKPIPQSLSVRRAQAYKAIEKCCTECSYKEPTIKEIYKGFDEDLKETISEDMELEIS